jgi:hypothetical protein
MTDDDEVIDGETAEGVDHNTQRHTRNMRCDLCYYTGGSNAVFNSIPKYVNDNIDKVHIDEMCRQISTTIRVETNIQIDPAGIKRHITSHMMDRKILNCLLLKDLRRLLHTTGKLCVVRDLETNAEMIDHKTTSTYLDVVKQIMTASKLQ